MATASIDRRITLSQEKYEKFLKSETKNDYVIKYEAKNMTEDKKNKFIKKLLGE